MTTRPSVMFVGESGDSPSAYYRCSLPAQGLRRLGWSATVRHTIWPHPPSYRIVSGEINPDVIVLRRMVDTNGEPVSCFDLIRYAIEGGQRVYIDLDDDPWHIPDDHPAYTFNKRRLGLWEADMAACSGLIVSTPALERAAREHLPHTPVHVCRNGIDATLYEPFRDKPAHLPCVGWLGDLNYRRNDLELAIPGIKLAKEKFPHIKFAHLGMRGPDPMESVFDFSVPWQPVGELPRLLATLDFAIVPMVANQYNRARSNVTGLALMAAGVPFLASPRVEYVELWEQGACWITSNDSWTQAITGALSQSTTIYQEMRATGIKLATERYSPLAMAEAYVHAFTAETASHV